MRPSLDELIEDLTRIRMEQALDDALLVFSDATSLQVLVDVTEGMKEALAKRAWSSIPSLLEEVAMFRELHGFGTNDEEVIAKKLLQMQISINLSVIEYARKAYQEAHSTTYFQERMETFHSLLSDEDPFGD